jgi:NTE family protein
MRSGGGAAAGGAPDPVRPRSFAERYGDGVERGACLGAGGTFFVAWQLGYLETLARHGVHIDQADRLVGTSAGSIVATTLARGALLELFLESKVLSLAPALMRVLFPSNVSKPSQQAALDLYLHAEDSAADTILAIGRAARAADTPAPETMSRNLLLVIGERWDSEALWMTTVDADTGDRCVITAETGVPVANGAAASSAVPGIFAPQPIAGHTCMDGGVSGTVVHLDLLAGAKKALVLALYRDDELTTGMLTLAPGDLTRELDALKGSGTEVFFRAPEHHPMDIAGLMDPKAVPDAMAMGARQATEDMASGGIAEFWA